MERTEQRGGNGTLGPVATALCIALPVLLTALAVLYAKGIFVKRIAVPQRTVNTMSNAACSYDYDLKSKTLTISSRGDDDVYYLAPFITSGEANAQNLLAASGYFDYSPAVVFALNDLVQQGVIEHLRVETSYNHRYDFTRDASGRLTKCHIFDAANKAPITLQYRYDRNGNLLSISGGYDTGARETESGRYVFACTYHPNGTLKSLETVNRHEENRVDFTLDAQGRFKHLNDGPSKGTMVGTDFHYDENGSLRSESSRYGYDDDIIEKTVEANVRYNYRKDNRLSSIDYGDHSTKIEYQHIAAPEELA